MKILYHHRIRSKDGQYVHLEELVNALRNSGHEVVIVGPRAIETGSFGADAGPVAALKRALPQAVYELLELAYSLLALGRLIPAILRHRPDVIYERYNLLSPAGIWAKRLFRIPLLLEVNAPLYEERKRFDGIALDRLARWSEVFAWRGADRVLPVTHVLAGHTRRAGVPDEQTLVIPNGVDRQKFLSGAGGTGVRRHLNLEGKIVLGFVGFMREWHGLERLIDILADKGEDDWHLLLVGDGPVRAQLLEHAKQREVSDQVTITGIVERARVPEHIRAFDIALQPDVVEYASPLKLIEYLAAGLAIIAPDSANIRELIEHGRNGLLFDRQEPKSLENAIVEVCQNPGLRSGLGNAASRTIERDGLTWEANARRVIEAAMELQRTDRSLA